MVENSHNVSDCHQHPKFFWDP